MDLLIKETLIGLANTLENDFKSESEFYEDENLEIEYFDTEKFSYKYLSKTFGYGINEDDNIYDAYGSTIIDIDGMRYAYLNTYGQEDNWYDIGLKFDIILVSNEDINIITKTLNNEYEFFYGKINNKHFDIIKLGGKRAYYFNNKTKKVLLRYSSEDYYKYFKENQTLGSENDLSGEKLTFIIDKI